MLIALDAMGGDLAPVETVRGALRALRDRDDIGVVLVGREADIQRELETAGQADVADRLSIVHAEHVIEGHEHESRQALRKKRDSSTIKAFQLVAEGRADAVVSAGNTGAAVGAGTLLWRLIPGIYKAGIAVALGTRDRHTVLVDVGANIHCKPVHLLHYGMMASIYSEKVLGHAEPRVALLNIGTEDGKGNELIKETRELFEDAPFNYIGHVEGNDIFAHSADVIVCEGFLGNVVLKTSEGLSETMHRRFEEIVGQYVDPAKHPRIAKHVEQFRQATDYAEIGGAPLLGVNGTCLICHGRSDGRAIGNAVKLAAKFVESGVLDTIHQGLASS